MLDVIVPLKMFISLRTADVSPRSSPLRDVSRGGTSATQRQKFHTDDAKSVRNPVISANWSTEQFHCFSYCLRKTDKRQKAAKVKCKRDESLLSLLLAELPRAKLARSGAPWVRKFGKLSIPENLVMT